MIFVKELEKYSEKYLNTLFQNDTKIIDYLTSKKILAKNDFGLFAFEYVGIVLIKDRIIFVLPKYIKKLDSVKVVTSLLELFGQYSKREKLDQEELETFGLLDSTNSNNTLSTLIFLMHDYIENGIYKSEINANEINGMSDIIWNKTIDESNPVITNKNIIYLEYFTETSITDENDYFMQLHKYILGECSRRLKDIGLLEYLGLSEIDFNINSDIGTEDYIIKKLTNELSIQFTNRKQLVLKAMISYFQNEINYNNNTPVELYGTRNFNVIWEKTCSFVLNNRFDLLKKYIAHPQWSYNGEEYTAPTIKPDIICLSKINFSILDAKYYVINTEANMIKDNPGVGDVTKQYLYHLALREIIKKTRIKIVTNIFLVPSENKKMRQAGIVKIDFLNNLGLENIRIYEVPAKVIFKLYSNGRKLNIDRFIELELVFARKY